ncbi:hypothetical protein PFISCL1PPCAC_11683, partial [Pristionchus fissidentatus]
LTSPLLLLPLPLSPLYSIRRIPTGLDLYDHLFVDLNWRDLDNCHGFGGILHSRFLRFFCPRFIWFHSDNWVLRQVVHELLRFHSDLPLHSRNARRFGVLWVVNHGRWNRLILVFLALFLAEKRAEKAGSLRLGQFERWRAFK